MDSDGLEGALQRRLGLSGRRAVIIGGGGGLGRACADDLAGAGVHLALADRNPEGLAASAQALAQPPVTVMTEVLDARQPEALESFYSAVAAHFGGQVDIVVNVVGGTFRQDFDASTPRGWDSIIRANFTWLLHSTHWAIPLLRAAGGGSIINITSIEGHRAAPGFAVYSGMKAAVTNFSRTLAVELAADSIRVNTIAPDFVPTEGMAAPPPARDDAAEFGVQLATPLGRPGTYRDVGGAALFLASELSSFVTGSTIHPDGGALAAAGWQHWGDGQFSLRPPEDLLAHYLDQRG